MADINESLGNMVGTAASSMIALKTVETVGNVMGGMGKRKKKKKKMMHYSMGFQGW